MDFDDAVKAVNRRIGLRTAILHAVSDVAKEWDADASDMMLALDDLAEALEAANHEHEHNGKEAQSDQ